MPAPSLLRHLKNSVSAIPIPSAPLNNNKRISLNDTEYKNDPPKKNKVGINKITANKFLNEFKAIGWTVSPLFLNKITAKAQTIAVIRESVSPK